MTKLWIGRSYLGDKLITKTTFNDDEEGRQWLAYFKADALANQHPEFRLEVDEYDLAKTEVYRPENPRTLEEMGL